MKKIILLFAIFVFFTLSGCSENSVGPINHQEPLQADFLYISMGQPAFQTGAVFYVNKNSPTVIETDLNPKNIIKYAFTDPSKNTVQFWYYAEGDTVILTAKKTPFKFSEIPATNYNYPFNGIGIVYNHNLSYRFDETNSYITVFDHATGETSQLQTQRKEEFGVPYIQIQNNINLKHGPCTTCNVKRWINVSGDYSAYMPWGW